MKAVRLRPRWQPLLRQKVDECMCGRSLRRRAPQPARVRCALFRRRISIRRFTAVIAAFTGTDFICMEIHIGHAITPITGGGMTHMRAIGISGGTVIGGGRLQRGFTSITTTITIRTILDACKRRRPIRYQLPHRTCRPVLPENPVNLLRQYPPAPAPACGTARTAVGWFRLWARRMRLFYTT